jgi:type IV secretory pathway TrbF-like protein
MKRSSDAIAGDPENPHSAVYLAARREWNERYGSYIAQANAWRLTALASLSVAFVAVAGAVWIGAQNRIVPYVVQTDRLGDAIAISRADISAPVDPRLIRAQLARWVNNVRSVYTDVAAEKHVITEAYAMVDRDAAGAQALNDWFSNNDPFKRARDETVAVAVESVLPLSGDTWRVEWREDRRARQGEKAPPEQWQATITISVSPPSDDATILINPTGLYVEAFNWSRRQ